MLKKVVKIHNAPKQGLYKNAPKCSLSQYIWSNLTVFVMVNESMVDLFHLENGGNVEVKSVLALYTTVSTSYYFLPKNRDWMT